MLCLLLILVVRSALSSPSPPFPSPPMQPFSCKIANALNYNPSNYYLEDNSLCIIPGCTDSNDIRYDENATYMDGSCTIVNRFGCLDSSAENYMSFASMHDVALCKYKGCMDSSANNFQLSASLPDICTYDRIGCMDSNAENYDVNYNIHDESSCLRVGCNNMHANNYDPIINYHLNNFCSYTAVKVNDDYSWFYYIGKGFCGKTRQTGNYTKYTSIIFMDMNTCSDTAKNYGARGFELLRNYR